MVRGQTNRRTTQERPFALPLSEETIQRAVFKHLRDRGAKGVIAWHCKNGGVHQKSPVQRAINSSLGVMTGASDVMALHKGKFYALELKAEGEEPTPEQHKFLMAVRDAGGTAGWAAGLDEALCWLQLCGLLMGKAA